MDEKTPILALCRRLADMAEALDRRRRPVEAACGETLWRGLGPGAGAWYEEAEALYRALDPLIRRATPALCAALLADPEVLAMEGRLHRLRAALEADKERALARALLAAPDRAERLARLFAAEAYWALSPELRQAVGHRRRLLVAGSGPLPLTALGLASLGAEVTCLDRDEEALVLGQALLARTPLAGRLRSRLGEAEALEDLADYEAVVAAVLLGVPTAPGQGSRRTVLARQLAERLAPGAPVILRDPHGLGRLLYPALELDGLRGFAAERLLPAAGTDPTYRVSLLVLRRPPC